jgi:gluconate kinase
VHRLPSRRHINPDHFLDTGTGRVYTPQRSDDAWQQAYCALSDALRNAKPGAELFVVVGVQGAGKSTWVGNNLHRLGAHAVFFDAAMPARVHRERVVAHALRSGVPAVAVWVDLPLALALARNGERPSDERVPEAAVRSVFAMMERPSVDEGFVRVIEVRDHLPVRPSTGSRRCHGRCP